MKTESKGNGKVALWLTKHKTMNTYLLLN